MAAPLAVKVAVPPGQIVAEFTVTVGVVTTFTVTVMGEAVQEPLLPLRVYTVVVGGLAVTVPLLTEDKLVAGLQV